MGTCKCGEEVIGWCVLCGAPVCDDCGIPVRDHDRLCEGCDERRRS